MKKITSIILSLVIFCSLFTSRAKADGMILPPDQYLPIYETEQKALIIYKDGREDLIISISFAGEANEFGWVIPLPNKPEISKVDSSLFRKLGEFTEPKENLLEKIRGNNEYNYPMYGVMELGAAKDSSQEGTTVKVIEEKSIGIYDYAILQAEKVDDLEEWMDENNYSLPNTEGSDDDWLFENDDYPGDYKSEEEAWSDAKPVIQDYIDSDWYFVTVKVNNEFTDSTGVESQLSEGAVDPLRFSFETTDMIYPMKLTALAERDMSILLYVIDDHKVRVDNYNYDYCSSDDEDCSYFDTQYAGKISKEEIEELTKEVGKGSWYEAAKNMRITKLYSSYLPFIEMDEEVLFKDTKNNQGVNDGNMSIGEWIQLPFVLVVYLPYLLFGGIIDTFAGGYYGYDLGLAWFIAIAFILFIGSIIWTIISLFLVKRARKKVIRLFLYITQLPAVWFLGIISSLLIVLPISIAISPLIGNEEIILFNGVCCFSFLSILFPLAFYRMLWRWRRKKKSK